jgi:peptide/nickel transport system ATP-binding protein/oligopeptide transport system ATP-binding protein
MLGDASGRMENGMENVLEVRDLQVKYFSRKNETIAVDKVDFSLKKGEILGIVGESGCGKSTLVRALVKLYDSNNTKISRGQVMFGDTDITAASKKNMRKIRGGKISMVFQNPLSALNPVYTVGKQIDEVIMEHRKVSRREAKEMSIELLRKVHIPSPEIRYNDYPHQLSGGMQQRVVIAIALACEPEIIIADEPTTALDVTVQAQILDLLRELNQKENVSIIIITHNLGVVAQICDRIMVMYGGTQIEYGSTKEVLQKPKHPYTKGLIAAIPSISEDVERLNSIEGQIPVFNTEPTECRFANRCSGCCAACLNGEPALIDTAGHGVRCVNV